MLVCYPSVSVSVRKQMLVMCPLIIERRLYGLPTLVHQPILFLFILRVFIDFINAILVENLSSLFWKFISLKFDKIYFYQNEKKYMWHRSIYNIVMSVLLKKKIPVTITRTITIIKFHVISIKPYTLIGWKNYQTTKTLFS